jgi:histidyl-tRNA synthetase
MSKKDLIQPRTLKGFRDHPPASMIPREWLIDTARKVYRSFGFSPIDTPALEYTEVLLGKGGAETDKQMYRFQDHGDRDVALRFDLTIPFARFAAQHIGELGTPFKRYHVGPVWRGENTQRGRYREFLQCDFDTIGTEAVVADIESVLVIHELFQALDVGGFKIRLNHRGVLSGMLERLELTDKSTEVLRALDKLDKIGPDKVVAEMIAEGGATETQGREVLRLTELTGSPEEILAALPPLVAGSESGEAGLTRLGEILSGTTAAGVSRDHVQLDLAIARGLDYYTGVVFETFLDSLPGIGSCCSGGRYDDLASLYTKERLPGVGASLGVDRLLAALEELGKIDAKPAVAPVFLAFFDGERRDDHLALAAELRRAGIGVELYPEARKLKAQLKYADRRGHRIALIAGGDEWERGVVQVKDLADKTTTDVPRAGVAEALLKQLG